MNAALRCLLLAGGLILPLASLAQIAESAASADALPNSGAVTAATAVSAASAASAQRPLTVLPLRLPAHGRLRFELTRGRFVAAQAVHEWQHDGKRYDLQSVTETVGLVALLRSARVVMHSRGNITAQGLQPLEYRGEKRGKLDGGARFDWARMRLLLDAGPQRELALLPHSQDMLSMFYQLSLRVAELQRADRGSRREFVMPVTNGRKLERYRFELRGEETLNLPRLGQRQTLHLHTHAGDQLIDVWLDLQQQGLPVKIRYTDAKGDAYDQTAVEISMTAAEASPATSGGTK
ncbi:MAG: DUF3108 domain-containing protein [Sterolibacterium sp.]|nr:DUF3108 domain-containing protein [Sterolibacterium sp.]